MRHFSKEQAQQHRINFMNRIRADYGIEDTSGLEIQFLIQVIAHTFIAINEKYLEADDLSFARWQILMHLKGAENRGEEGITPTALSHVQRVSKNTVSVLLRGLEEQGYITRDLDPQDFRKFRIKLTDEGRTYISHSAPEWIGKIAGMSNQLTLEERQELVRLLSKLHSSFLENWSPNKG
jgi:DNA-binding MarR family transcriptional regulator